MTSISQELRQATASVELLAFPGARPGFAARVAAIDFLEIHVFDRLDYLDANLPAELQEIRTQAVVLRTRLETANERFLQMLRRRIRSGRYTRDGLKRAFSRFSKKPDGQGDYDALDLLVGGLLSADDLDEEHAVREPDMVAYQPTPARAILDLIHRANLHADDVLYDLGSGLGQVVILVSLLSGVRAKGVEFEPAFCDYARRSALELNASGVEFIQADARAASLEEGTVFFMFTPFRGVLMQQVLERLRAEADKRPIRVCTYGPCTTQVGQSSWLKQADEREFGEYEIAVFHSVRTSNR